MELIGLSGKAGTGKDWTFEHYLRPLGYHRWALADAFKITAVGRKQATYDEVFVTKPPHVRAALQKTGTEEGRLVYGESVWCDTALAWMQHLQKTWGVSKFAVTDIRFVNEVQFVQNLGGKVLRLVAPGRYATNAMDDHARLHASETSLDEYNSFDAFVLNDPMHADVLKNQVEFAVRGETYFLPWIVAQVRESERRVVRKAQERITEQAEKLQFAAAQTQAIEAELFTDPYARRRVA